MTISLMPAIIRVEIGNITMGLLKTGNSCLENAKVKGRNLDPVPPASTIPTIR